MKRSPRDSSGQKNYKEVSSSSKSNTVVDEPAVSDGKYSDASEPEATARASKNGQENDQDVSSSSKSNSVEDEPAVSDGKYSDASETTARASKNGQDNHQELPHENPIDASTGGFQYLEMSSVRLYQAALNGDWQLAKAIFEEDSDVFRRRITQANETALHIAVAAERADLVKELVKWMAPKDLKLTNYDGCTTLYFAALSGLVLIAKAMVKVNRELPLIRGSDDKTPLYVAALNGRRKMVSYLYPLTPFEDLEPIERIDILVTTISTDMYGMSYIDLTDIWVFEKINFRLDIVIEVAIEDELSIYQENFTRVIIRHCSITSVIDARSHQFV